MPLVQANRTNTNQYTTTNQYKPSEITNTMQSTAQSHYAQIQPFTPVTNHYKPIYTN
eukprot:m.62185 g.62185  ORF g.62185 m.62185 type:complete len:57 (+) comp19341_c0_seq4:105-275(+)